MTPTLKFILTTLPKQPNNYTTVVAKYAMDLESKGLPIIFTTEHLGLLLGSHPGKFREFIDNVHLNYSSFPIRKKSGGNRWVMAPNEDLKFIQQWIKHHILEKIEVHPSANGFVKSKGLLSNATPHIDKELILNIDLYRFFDTISSKRVYGIFKNLGYHTNLSYDLAKLLCATAPKPYWKEIIKEYKFRKKYIRQRLPILSQGSPASPIISNIVCRMLDLRLSKLCDSMQCHYTRYADDITISGDRQKIPSLLTIKKIIRQEGFYINKDKIKHVPNNKRQTVTGVVVNKKTRVAKQLIKQVNQHLYYCQKYGPQNHLEHLQSKGDFPKSNYKQWLLGKISFINSIESSTAKKLFERFNRIEWEL
ncbi:MAG: reverse transcriptase family protein [Chitinophagaceae bacterium]